MTSPKPPPYEHTDPEHPGSGCPGCTPLSRELDYLRAELAEARAALNAIVQAKDRFYGALYSSPGRVELLDAIENARALSGTNAKGASNE